MRQLSSEPLSEPTERYAIGNQYYSEKRFPTQLRSIPSNKYIKIKRLSILFRPVSILWSRISLPQHFVEICRNAELSEQGEQAFKIKLAASLNVNHKAENRLHLGPTTWALAASIRCMIQVVDIKVNTLGQAFTVLFRTFR